MILFYDTETYSETPLSQGTHAYAESLFAEVMVESWAIDDGEVQVADRTAGEIGPWDVYDPEDFDAIVMHQSDFDRTVTRLIRGIEIPIHLIHDTAVRARSHGLPGGLDKLCAIFKVPEGLAKHSEGRQLIQRFCKPQPKSHKVRRWTRHNDPEGWKRFLSYAGGDIHAMRYLYSQLPRWNYPNREHPLWVLDQQINDRGFKVDLDLAHAAIEAISEINFVANAETAEQTEGRVGRVSQRDKLLRELLLEHHVQLPDLTQTTLERRLDDPDLPLAAKALIERRLMQSATSTSKYKKIIEAVSDDGRLRNSILFCGAPRTKRDSGRLFQPQNLPRPDMPVAEIEQGIELLKMGLLTMGGDLLRPYDPAVVMRLTWNALRGLIVAGPGKKIVQADLAGIEARVLPWLAREEWKLDAFRAFDAGTGPDIYCVTASKALKREIAKGMPERQSHGKHPELACGYGGSVGALQAIAELFNYQIDVSEAHDIVQMWREAHVAIANWTDGFWVQLESAARNAILYPGTTFEAGSYIRFEKWRNWLKMELPSGGFLSYADPHIGEHKHGGSNSLCFWGINSYSRRWERLYTYGGKLSADATQATAREIFAYNWQHVEDEGFPIVLRIHDELVTEPPDDPALSVEKLVAALTRRPPWIDDNLPLSAGGFEAQRYRKDD